MSNKLNTIIEITPAHVKLLQFRGPAHAPVITGLDIGVTGGLSDEAVGAALSHLIAGRAIEQERLTLVLPRRYILMKKLRLPSTQERDIHKMIPLQLVELTHYPLKDVAFNFSVLEKESDGYSQVIVYIVPREVKARFAAILLKLKLYPSKYILSSSGIVACFLARKDAQQFNTRAAVLVVNMDCAHTELCFVYEQRLRYSRHLDYGIRDIADGNISGLAGQIEFTLKAYRKDRGGPEAGLILVVVPSADYLVLLGGLADHFKVPVQVDTMQISISFAGDAILQQGQKHPDVSLVTSLGLIAGHGLNAVDLTTREERRAQDQRNISKKMIRLAVLLTLTLLTGAGTFAPDLFFKMERLNQINAQVRSLKPQVKAAQKLIAAVDSLDAYFSKRIFLPGILLRFQQSLPAGVFFRSLEGSGEGDFVILGFARSGAGVSALQARLVESAAFANVQLLFSTKSNAFKEELVEFKIQLKLKPEGVSG